MIVQETDIQNVKTITITSCHKAFDNAHIPTERGKL